MLNQKQKPLLIQVPGMDMVAMDTVATMAVVTMEDTDILTTEDTDTTVERDLLMPNQKQKLPLIQAHGTDMVATTATHTDMVVITEDTHTDMEVTMEVTEDTIMVKPI